MTLYLSIILGFFLCLPNAFGFNWTWPALPQQCSNITMSVFGTDFVFPLKALIVPVGPSPLSYEVRRVMEVDFPANTTTVSFLLPYPTGSELVGLVSDGLGYRAGNTGSILKVASSGNSSCFDPTRDAVPLFRFSLSPRNIAECRDVRIYWDAASVQGSPSFLAVIPNGGFEPIAVGKIDTQAGLGTGFSWKPPGRAGMNLTIVGGDNRGMGAGGFISSYVGPGDPRDLSGACPTSSSSTSDAPLNIGAIAGGIAGGVFLLVVIIVISRQLLRKKPSRVVEFPKPQLQRPPFSYYAGDMNGPPPIAPQSQWQRSNMNGPPPVTQQIQQQPSNIVAPPTQPHYFQPPAPNRLSYYAGDTPVTPQIPRRPSNIVSPPAPPAQPHLSQIEETSLGTRSNIVAPFVQPHLVQGEGSLGQPPPYTADPQPVTTAGANPPTSESWKRHHAQTSASLDDTMHTPWTGERS